MKYCVILKSLNNPEEQITLSAEIDKTNAEQSRRSWRRILGDKRWKIDRRPGLDTLDHLALTIIKVESDHND